MPESEAIPSEAIPSEERLWAELRKATLDRHHEWRTPVLATVEKRSDQRLRPCARVVVLRSAEDFRLRVFTHSQSRKVQQLEQTPEAELTFWSRRLHWQLRASGMMSRVMDKAELQRAWERIRQGPTVSDYMDDCAQSDGPREVPLAVEDSFFCVLEMRVSQLDWLQLASPRHLEARFCYHHPL